MTMNLDPKALIAAYDAFAATGISADHEGISAAITAYLSASTAGVPGEQTEALKLTPAMISAARKASSIYDLSEKWQRHERVMRTGDFSFEFTQMWNAALSASLSSPPVSQQAEAVGWLYNNEDTGREFSEQHPVESGEVPDATNVEPATASNLLAELRLAWSSPAPDAVEPAKVKALEWRKAALFARNRALIVRVADTVLGRYSVCQAMATVSGVLPPAWISPDGVHHEVADVEAGAIAAQTHFDAAIRSALVHTSPVSAPGVVEELRAEVLRLFKANGMESDERLAILIAEYFALRSPAVEGK